MRLTRARLDHPDVGAAAGEEDDQEGEEAKPVALAAGSVGASLGRLVGGRGISS